MTFKELLDCVRFEDVAPLIVKMYPDMGQSLGWYKIHFDMLRLMQPVFHEDANDKVCHITMEDWEDGSGLHLDAYPMEGDLWEHSLTKELIIEQGIKATNEELAACCLWHTSFYGFVEKHVKERFRIEDLDVGTLDRWDDSLYYKATALQNFSIIREHGGFIPTIRQLSKSKKAELIKQAKDSMFLGSTPMNRIKRKKHFRIEFLEHYYERMSVISDFIVQAIPALKGIRNYILVEQLCELFKSELFGFVVIPSYAEENEDSATYLLNLIQKYDMLPKADNVILYMARGYEYTHAYDDLRKEERRLYDTVCEIVGQKENIGSGDLIIDIIPELGRQTLIWVVAYNGKPIAE